MKNIILLSNTENDQQAKPAHNYSLSSKSNISFKKSVLVSALSLLSALPVYAVSVDTVQQPSIFSKSASGQSTSAFLGKGTQSFSLNLPTIQIDLNTTVKGVQKTGAVYQLPAPVTPKQLSWEHVSGGYVARIHLFSEQAKRLRYHLLLSQDIPSITFRLKGSGDNVPLTPVDHNLIHDGSIWLPITNGNQADLEIFVDETTSPDAVLSIDAISVIVADFHKSNDSGIQAKSLGKAKQQEYDLACAASHKDYPALQQAASATALINFVKDGSSYGCTGTLLNDKNSTFSPWFATANHCISDQATANTATFEWFFQATSCGGSTTDSRATQTSGGAQLLWADEYLEGAFLKLNTQPPKGVSYMGWDTNIQVGEAVWGVHHPKFDHTMVSLGKVTALGQTIRNIDTGKNHFTNRIVYSAGGTESGSSGSGIFSIVNGSAYWKGTLFGGPENNYQESYYSDFNSYYPYIKAWLVAPVNNPDIEKFYGQYLTYFGSKSGKNYICYVDYTCQNFAANKIIALQNKTKSLYWFDGAEWKLYR